MTAPLARRLAVALLGSALAAVAAGGPLGAQSMRPRGTLFPEARADLLAAEQATTAHGGVGLLWQAGRYVQAGLVVGGGVTRQDAARTQPDHDATVGSVRAELVARFVVDPLADPFVPSRTAPRWLLFGGAGGGLLAVRGEESRSYLLVTVGVMAPAWGRWRPSLELGLGGGTRVGVALRRE